MSIEDKVWAGTEVSLQAALQSEEARAARVAAGDRWENDEEKPSRLLQIDDDGLAILSIKGPLNNDGDAWWNDYIGATGYPEIREALVEAATDERVQHILLDIDSGGGSVAGLFDTAQLVRMVNDRVKPVTAFTDSHMYSAAYALGSAAGKVHASKGAGVGSIGVIATHMERSKMLAEAGIGVNVIRAGKYKALANSVEPLSDEGRKQIQAGVDAAYTIFVDHVSTMRGKSAEFVDSVMAQGREFYGQAAADASLVDSITTLDAVVSEVKQKFVDGGINSAYDRTRQPSRLRAEHQGDAEMASKKTTLTDADIAALAAGASLGASASQEPQEPVAEVPVNEPAADVEQTPEAAPEASATMQQVDTAVSAVKVLSDQLKASQDELVATRVKLAGLEEKFAEQGAFVEPLRDIAVKAVNNLRVALGGTALDMANSTPAQILAEHATLSETFTAKYKAGGVAAVDAAQAAPKHEHKVDARTKARIDAVRFSK